VACLKAVFEGSSPASVIAAIMERPAPSIADVAPPALDRVLQKCLAKDPDNRWQSARDLKDELEWIASSSGEAIASSTRSPSRFGRLPWIAAVVLIRRNGRLCPRGVGYASRWSAPNILPI
jgi:serine/threonine protein kinase